jgi:hypothetical protein
MALDRYVEAELGGPDARARFPGVALHLTMCPACRSEHDGLLALIDHDARCPCSRRSADSPPLSPA